MGDGIRARRRIDSGFIWEIYNLTYGIDERFEDTSGSFSLFFNIYKKAARSYSVSSDGTINLTNATQKTAANITVGDYLVDISTSSDKSTSGSTLYKVTAVTGNSIRYEISYVAYTPVENAKGTNTGERVSSKTLDYPFDGIRHIRWYTLIKGTVEAYVWNTYVPVDNGWQTEKSTSGDTGVIYGAYMSGCEKIDTNQIYYSEAEPTILANGTASFSNSAKIIETYNALWSPNGFDLANSEGYFAPKASGNTYFFQGYKNKSSGDDTADHVYLCGQYRHDIYYDLHKGESIGIAISERSNQYPTDGIVNGVWYEYSHRGTIRIDNT